MKIWMQKLVGQIDLSKSEKDTDHLASELSEEKATLLFFIDTISKHLIEIESHPSRSVRETLDSLSKEIIEVKEPEALAKALFRLRQFFASYRISEFTYVQTTFDEFRRIIWDFVDQLAEDLTDERKEDIVIKTKLGTLREAVESNSIEALKTQSRQFIDAYITTQSKKETRRTKRVDTIKKNLEGVKKQLVDAQNDMKYDHLTGAYNRRYFDEQLRKLVKLFSDNNKSVTLVTLDIDHFKKVNDTFGHDAGDMVLQECVKLIQGAFTRPEDIVARIGGEEFAIVLPDFKIEHAIKLLEPLLTKIRGETFLQGSKKIKFTISAGIASWIKGEKVDAWLKRADQALYQSKNSGRDRYTVAPNMLLQEDTPKASVS